MLKDYPKCKIDVKEINPKTNKEFTKFSLNIGDDVGNDLSRKLNDATTYINIISPYISNGYIKTLNTLKNKNPNLDIRLIFSDKSDFLKKEAETLRELIKLNWKVNPIKQDKQQKALKNISKKITFFKLFSALEILFIILSFIILRKYFYQILGLLTISFLFTLIKINALKKKWTFIRNSSVEDPSFTSAFKFKCVKKYFLEETEKSNLYSFPHVKLYLIGLTSSTKITYCKAFLGSANFTFSGLGNPNNSKPVNYKTNIESLISTTDNDTCEKLKKFFEDMYEYDFPEHSIDFIGRNIYQNELDKKYSYFK